MDFDLKLAILFLLIGAIVCLSLIGGGSLERVRRRAAARQWRGIMPLWRKD